MSLADLPPDGPALPRRQRAGEGRDLPERSRGLGRIHQLPHEPIDREREDAGPCFRVDERRLTARQPVVHASTGPREDVRASRKPLRNGAVVRDAALLGETMRVHDSKIVDAGSVGTSAAKRPIQRA